MARGKLSSEESDLYARSNKKVKTAGEQGDPIELLHSGVQPHDNGGDQGSGLTLEVQGFVSFKDKLCSTPTDAYSVRDEQMSLSESESSSSDEESEAESEEEGGLDIPVLEYSQEEYDQWCLPWRLTLGKFARICVELNLKRKLVPHVVIRGRCYGVEYEGLHLICFHCGKYGHQKGVCPDLKVQSENAAGMGPSSSGGKGTVVEQEGKGGSMVPASSEVDQNHQCDENGKVDGLGNNVHYGPWMQVRKHNRRRDSAARVDKQKGVVEGRQSQSEPKPTIVNIEVEKSLRKDPIIHRAGRDSRMDTFENPVFRLEHGAGTKKLDVVSIIPGQGPRESAEHDHAKSLINMGVLKEGVLYPDRPPDLNVELMEVGDEEGCDNDDLQMQEVEVAAPTAGF
ncbi:LIM domain-containing protein A-like [Senna tora]|uniref:LIM domain-containing protein A-like n=1 Tax=Senna tora TaxID=362788 RepID=A0A834WSW8_9FABA|nr:LIM domain-containing protein A-like [Senna tora]